MENFRGIIAPVAQIATLATLVGVIVLWGYRLEHRVDRHDALIQTLIGTPPGYDPTLPRNSVPPDKNPTPLKDSSPPQSLPDRFSATCATLAERAAQAAAWTSTPSAMAEIKKLMNELGCMAKEK